MYRAILYKSVIKSTTVGRLSAPLDSNWFKEKVLQSYGSDAQVDVGEHRVGNPMPYIYMYMYVCVYVYIYICICVYIYMCM